jgi:hypothetical protein
MDIGIFDIILMSLILGGAIYFLFRTFIKGCGGCGGSCGSCGSNEP